MKILIAAFLLFSANLFAQNSFRIFDMQNNDVTGGIFTVTDTSTQAVQVQFNVENIDSVAYSVTAGRLVLSVPQGSSNAITWNLINYPPQNDSSFSNPIMIPQNVQPFVADYFPNGNLGIATINYCFWDRSDMNNNSCVAVTFNIIPNGIGSPDESQQVKLFPNPVNAGENLQLNWNQLPGEKLFMHLYNPLGESVLQSFEMKNGTASVSLAGFAPGIYIVELGNEYSALCRYKIVVQ